MSPAYPQNDSSSRRGKLFFAALGLLGFAVLMAAIVWFFAKIAMAELEGLGTKTFVRSGAELSEKTIAVLIEENIIEPGDKVQYFYSEGVFSILEGGSVLTDREIIMYEPGEKNGTDVYLFKLEEVISIKRMVEGDFWTDEVYRISGADSEQWIEIYLSVEDDKHLSFVNALYASADNAVEE